jgi:phosphatidylserine synthase
LPIPLAAASLTSLVLLHYKMGGGVELGRQPLMIAVMLLLAVLMISKVRYRTFKAFKAKRLAMSTIIVLAIAFLIAAWKTSFALAFMVVCTLMIALGPAEELVRLVLRLRIAPPVEQEAEEEEEEEETV